MSVPWAPLGPGPASCARRARTHHPSGAVPPTRDAVERLDRPPHRRQGSVICFPPSGPVFARSSNGKTFSGGKNTTEVYVARVAWPRPGPSPGAQRRERARGQPGPQGIRSSARSPPPSPQPAQRELLGDLRRSSGRGQASAAWAEQAGQEASFGESDGDGEGGAGSVRALVTHTRVPGGGLPKGPRPEACARLAMPGHFCSCSSECLLL